MCHRQQPEHPVAGPDAQPAVGGREPRQDRGVPEHHSLAPAGGAGGEAQIGRVAARGRRRPRAVDGRRASRVRSAKPVSSSSTTWCSCARSSEGLEDGAAVIVRDRHQTGAGGQDAERQLDEAPPLTREQPAAIARPHALGAQPLGVRLEDRDQLGGAQRCDCRPGRRRRQSAGCSGARARVLADPVDDRHGSPSSGQLAGSARARSRGARPAASGDAAHRRPARPRPRCASPVASAVPTTRSAPSASWLADRQRPAIPSRGCERLTSAPSGIEQAPAGYSKLRAPMVVPELDRPGRDGHLVVAARGPRARPPARARAVPTSRRVSRTPIRRGQSTIRLPANAGRLRAQESRHARAALARARRRARRATRGRAARSASPSGRGTFSVT